MSGDSNGGSRPIDTAWPERWFFHHVGERWPMRLRGLPWFRKFFWQKEELDEIAATVQRRKSIFCCGNCTSGDRRCVNPDCPGFGRS